VVFSHHPAWTGLPPDAFFDTLRRLGDEGWELVSALPLAAELSPVAAPLPAPAATPSPAERERERWGDSREPREGRETPAPPPTEMRLRVGTERWLLFKRPQPEPPAKGAGPADMVKDLLPVPPILKGKLPPLIDTGRDRCQPPHAG
jgi:hypothetical protein